MMNQKILWYGIMKKWKDTSDRIISFQSIDNKKNYLYYVV